MMSEKFTVEIISPDKTIIKTETSEVQIPSYEGEMGILKDHIQLITFLRPGIIKIKNDNEKEFFVEEGTVEFSNNNLLILTSKAKDLSNVDKKSLSTLLSEAEKKISDNKLTDKEKYLLSYKIDTLKKINNLLYIFFLKSTITFGSSLGEIHFHSINSGFLVFKFISLSSPKYSAINHFCLCPLNRPFQIIPIKFFGSSYSKKPSNSLRILILIILVSSSSSRFIAEK